VTDPWHTLTVTATYGHRNCACGETCKGHDTPEDDQDMDDIEVEHELTHPDDCPPRRPCCHQGKSDVLGIPTTCAACKAGAHQYCAESTLYRCQTEGEVGECYSENELPTASGVYRVRGWWSPGGYHDDPESGVECEPVPEASAES
jgi:hypothetical protein